MNLNKKLKIVYDKIYIEKAHVATIRFGQLLVKPLDLNKEELKYINNLALKLNLEIKNRYEK